ncbi:MAG: hypothetical protein JO013_02355 [Alphaproteobacteria bacterium]|nr:hypothetical protein [Alphaproteobacteria bacterium]
MRPRSIMLFETLSLAAVALGAAIVAMTWGALMASVYARIRGTGIEPAVMIMTALYVGLLILLILLTSRRASAVAKWLFAAIIVAEAVFTLPGLPAMLRGGLIGWAQIVQLALQLVALWFLFVPQSRAWLREYQTV